MTTEKQDEKTNAGSSSSNRADWGKAKSSSERQMETVETNFYQFENHGDAIEGYLVDKQSQRMRPNADGSPNIIGKYKLQLETETGEPSYTEFLGGTDIDSKLAEAAEALERGRTPFIRVTYSDDRRTSSGNRMKVYTVQIDRSTL